MAQETCTTMYERLEKLNPASQRYKDLYNKYLKECAGQERMPRKYCSDLRKACQNKKSSEENRVSKCYEFRDNCQD
jgi:hypothetical protein